MIISRVNCRFSLAAVVFLLGVMAGLQAHAQIVHIEHVGDNDPLTEGWACGTAGILGGASTNCGSGPPDNTPVSEDPSWKIDGDVRHEVRDLFANNPQLTTHGWTMEWNLRDTNPSGDSTHMFIYDGNNFVQIHYNQNGKVEWHGPGLPGMGGVDTFSTGAFAKWEMVMNPGSTSELHDDTFEFFKDGESTHGPVLRSSLSGTSADVIDWGHQGSKRYSRWGDVRLTQLSSGIPANTFTWNSSDSGDWLDESNWQTNGDPGFPNSESHSATFGNSISSNRTVFADVPVTASRIAFQNTDASFVIAGSGGVSIPAGSAGTGVFVTGGNHEFQTKVDFLNDAELNIDSGSTLTFNNALSLNGHTVTKTGDGTVVINNALNASGGTLLSLEGTISGIGTIGGDVTNHGVISPGDGNTADGSELVPEPTSHCLITIGCLMLLRCRRRRRDRECFDR